MSSADAPLVSVIMPVYNGAAYILETIQSVQKQNLQDWELVIVDDGSTDNTPALLARLSDPRIRVFVYPNGGVSTARNRGFSHSRGQFIALLDADDLWTPDKLSDQVWALQQSPANQLAYSRTYLMNESGKQVALVRSPRLPQGDVYRLLLTRNFIISIGSNILVRRQAWEEAGGFDPNLTQGEDWEFCCRIAARGDLVAVAKPQVYYRQHGHSASYQLQLLERATLATIDKMFQGAPSQFQTLKGKAQANAYQTITRLHLAQARTKAQVRQSWRYLGTSLIRDPRMLLSLSTWVLFCTIIVFTVLPLDSARFLLGRVQKTFSARSLSRESP